MPNQLYNPIQSVDGVAVPCPSKYDWKLSDVSDGDAGRTEDGLMHKMEVAQKVHIELEWQNIGDSAAAANSRGGVVLSVQLISPAWPRR